jgi:hypothetical protein
MFRTLVAAKPAVIAAVVTLSIASAHLISAAGVVDVFIS